MRPTQIFHFGRFFIFILLKLCKISHFWSNSKKIWLKIFEKNLKYFPYFFFLKKVTFFWDFCVFRGLIFATRKKEKKLKKEMSRPTDPTRKVRPPVKQGFFFLGLRYLLIWGVTYINAGWWYGSGVYQGGPDDFTTYCWSRLEKMPFFPGTQSKFPSNIAKFPSISLCISLF